MKTIVVYSSLTGNTRRVAEGLLPALPEGTLCVNVKEAPEPVGFDLVLLGFWVDRGQADAAMLGYFAKMKSCRTAFFFTLGAYPDSPHADEVAADTAKRLAEGGNQVLGHFRCQGRVDPALVERMKTMLPPDHPHVQMTPERQARLDEAAKHPDELDMERARAFVRDLQIEIGSRHAQND